MYLNTRMITRRRAEQKRRKMSEPKLVVEGILMDQIGKYIDSVVESVKKVLKLREKEVNILKEKYQLLELAKEERDREYHNLKSNLSYTKSCNTCKEKCEKVNAIKDELKNCEFENKRLLHHLYDKKLRIKKYTSILEERDKRIEQLESQVREASNTLEVKQTEVTEHKDQEDDHNDKKKESGQNILNLIDQTLLMYSTKAAEESKEIDLQTKATMVSYKLGEGKRVRDSITSFPDNVETKESKERRFT